jgi:photosystem II stability/assembly factor-like uncharacterized protein
MKKNILFVALLSLMGTICMAQTPVNDRWIESGNASENSELYSTAFPTAAIGYAVGSGGACLKTTNGGTSWSAINLNVPYDLLKITFLDANIGYIAGRAGYDYGKVLKTTDGGETWKEVLHMSGRLNTLFFLDAMRGWIAGYEKIMQTVDGGLTWITHEPSGFNDILSLIFVSPTIGFMTPNNASVGLQITRDGGITWNPTLSMYSNELDYTDINTIYTLKANSPGMVYKTTDQGANWVNVSTGLSGSLQAINFVSSTMGFVWSQDPHFGKIFRTSNAGQQWTLVYHNPLVNIGHVAMAPGGKLFAVGSGGLILSSTDGTQWNEVHKGAIKGTLRRVAFTDDLHGFAVGDQGSMIKTSDAGINWTPVNLGLESNLAGLAFVNEQIGFFAGDNSTFYKTSNGGATWTSANSGLNTPELRQIAAYDAQTVFAGSNNGIYVTKNGGSTWTQTAYKSIAYTLFMIDSDTILAAEIVKFGSSFDGGATWQYRSLSRTFFSMFFTSARKGFIGDSWGRINKTSDGMETWEQKYNCNLAIYDMTFLNDTIGYFVGDNGYIGKTTDGGENWFQVESGTIRNLRSIFFTPDGTGFIVGKDGMILRKAAVDTYTIDFTVFDEGAHAISDATISINNSVYPAGTYRIKGLIAGTYHYKVSRIGFKSVTGSIVIDDDDDAVEIILQAGIDAPVALAATSASASEFTANWEIVSAADYYLLYVSGNNFASHLSGYNGAEVDGLSHTVSGIEAGVEYAYRLKAVSTFAESEYSNSIKVTGTSGIESTLADQMVLYPNPATDIVHIDNGDQVLHTIEILDIYGRLIESRSGIQSVGRVYDIDISGLKPGVYQFRLMAGNSIQVKKIIVR